jgi:hypothetical protein
MRGCVVARVWRVDVRSLFRARLDPDCSGKCLAEGSRKDQGCELDSGGWGCARCRLWNGVDGVAMKCWQMQ